MSLYSHEPSLPISVIICTRNSMDRVLDTVESLVVQTIPRAEYEILLVDNASTDGTTDYLRELAERLGCRFLEEPELGLSAARNRGIREARGELLVFIDDDAVAPGYYLEVLKQDYESTEAELYGGAVHGLWDDTPPEWLLPSTWRRLSLLSYGPERRFLVYPEILIGTNMAFRRRVFERYGLFDPRFGRKGANLEGNEERELEKRIMEDGGRVLYNPRACVFHKVPRARMEMPYFEKRAEDGAYSIMLMRKLAGELEPAGPKKKPPRDPKFDLEPLWKKSLRKVYDFCRERQKYLHLPWVGLLGKCGVDARAFGRAWEVAAAVYKWECAIGAASRRGRMRFREQEKSPGAPAVAVPPPQPSRTVLPHNIRTHVIRQTLGKLQRNPDKPRVFLEIGCMFGLKEAASTLLLAEAARNCGAGAQVYSLDIDQAHLDAARDEIERYSPGLSQFVTFIEGNSVEVLPELLKDIPFIDLCWIDGGGHPEACLREFELLLPKMSDDGFILVDDCHALAPTENYPHPRDLGKGHLIVPLVLLTQYIANRDAILSNSKQSDKLKSDWLDSLAENFPIPDGLGSAHSVFFRAGVWGNFVVSREPIQFEPFQQSAKAANIRP